jgi:hypothetical protein
MSGLRGSTAVPKTRATATVEAFDVAQTSHIEGNVLLRGGSNAMGRRVSVVQSRTAARFGMRQINPRPSIITHEVKNIGEIKDTNEQQACKNTDAVKILIKY